MSSKEDAERRLIDALRERPTVAERLSRAVATRSNLVVAVVAVLGWLLLNQTLLVDVDPFPFHGLQRVLAGIAVALAMMVARANADREGRNERVRVAHHDLEEAGRWAAASRRLRIMGKTRSSTDPK